MRRAGISVVSLACLGATLISACEAPVPPPIIVHHFGRCDPMVFFDAGSATVSPQARSALKSFTEECSIIRNSTVVVAGHTDGNGAPLGNMALSRQRAQAVSSHLVSLGVMAESITIEAYGDTRPMVRERSPSIDAQNRRVHISLK